MGKPCVAVNLNINGINGRRYCLIFLETVSVALTAVKLESNITEKMLTALTLFYKTYSHDDRFLVADIEKALSVILL